MEIFEYKGIKFIRKNDLIVDRLIKEKQDFEKDTTDWILSNLEQNKLFVDVGHSTGWFSLQVIKKGFDVIGFEPMDPAYERAVENMKLNGIQYEIVKAAVSNQIGETTIYYNPSVPITTGASLDSSVRSQLNRKSSVIKTVTLDSILKDKLVSIIKIDVEGYELSVLEGAKSIIEKNRPKLVLEANDKNYENILAKWLKANSYQYKIVDERNMLCWPV